MTRYLPVFLTVGGLGALALAYVETEPTSIVESAQNMAAARSLRDLDSRIRSYVLECRAGDRYNYDAIVSAMSDQRAIYDTLVASEVLEGDGVLDADLAAIDSHQQLMADAIDRFKASHSVLSNSETYFPVASDTLLAELPEGQAKTDLLTLRSDMRWYQSTDTAGQGAIVEASLDRVAADAPEYPAFAGDYDALGRHGRAILTWSPQVDASLHDLDALGDAPFAQLEQAMAAESAEVLAWTDLSRRVVFGLCAILGLVGALGQLRLREQNDALESVTAANQSKSEFLANMSHEIRTPLTALTGYAELMLDPEMSASTRFDHVMTIRRNAEHLTGIINDILDLSKVESGRMTVERIPCSPARVLVEVVSLMRVRAIEKGLDLHVLFDGGVPTTILSDPTRLRQIVMNLVGNAIKFTDEGEVLLRVRCLDAEGAAPRLRLDVIDTGMGITEAEISRLFMAFTQADASTTRRFGGTGLGLAICKRLAEMLEGDVSVQSVPGKGSTFTLIVPTGPLVGSVMIDDIREAETPVPSVAGRHEAVVRLDGARILLAEDGRDNQLLLSTHLSKVGATVFVADNGKIALTMATEADAAGTPFHVILMDMQMPVLDGYMATARLRARGYVGPIVALTAHAMSGDRDKCIAAGCDDYLTKPITRATLLATVAKHAHGIGNPEQEALVSTFAGDPEMADLVESFAASLAEHVAQVRAADETGDRVALCRLGHQLKGAAGGYGFAPIGDAGARIERAAVAGDDGALILAIDELARLCARVPGSQSMLVGGLL